MKKIVFITTIPLSLKFFKGQLGFLNQKMDVYAISSKGTLLDEIAAEEGINVFEVEMERDISIRKDIKSLIEMYRTLRLLQPDIVHGNTPKAALLSLCAAFILCIPRRIYMCHGLRYQGATGLMRLLLMFMEKITCSFSTEVICVSDGVKQVLSQDNICSKKKTKVILNGSANGINLKHFSIDQVVSIENTRFKLSINNTDFVYIFIGRIVGDKGINELLKSFNTLSIEYSDIRLLLLGPLENVDQLSEETMNIMKTNQKVLHIDYQKDIRPFLLASDVLVLPSYREGFGVVLMEAAALSIPVIASNIIGCNNVVIENENGWLAAPRSEISLTKTMKKAYEDKENYAIIKTKTRESIQNRFDQTKLWDEFLSEYNQ